MGLKSTVLDFKGDSKLEACLVSDAAHIMRGASGAHVSKIQQALLRLDNLKINDSELSSRSYGPSTAAAVLQYKQKRHIINFSYQKKEDDIVGKMTIASLDNELANRFPFQQISPNDIQVAPDLPPPSLTPTTPKSRKFRIRCRGGYSFGPLVVAKVRMDFDFFDPGNNLSAEYRFLGGAVGLGTPISETGPGPFTDFSTSVDMPVNGFESPANFNGAGGGENSVSLLTLLAPPMAISVSTGFTLGIDVFSVSGGFLKLMGFHPGPPPPMPTPGQSWA
jgi:hypothetical protein